MPDAQTVRVFFKSYWPWIAVVGLVLGLALNIAVFRQSLFTENTVRSWVVIVCASAVLVAAQRAIYKAGPGDTDATYVRYTILFSSVMFIVVGLSTIIIACTVWMTPVLMAGGTLTIAGFIGLLFGYPSGVAQQSIARSGSTSFLRPLGQQGRSQPPVAKTVTQPSDKNLLAESSSTLGKVLTGFTLAKFSDLSHFVSKLCHTIGPAFGTDQTTNYLLAGGMLAYFVSVGFVSGLLLPSYFMGGRFAPAQ